MVQIVRQFQTLIINSLQGRFLNPAVITLSSRKTGGKIEAEKVVKIGARNPISRNLSRYVGAIEDEA